MKSLPLGILAGALVLVCSSLGVAQSPVEPGARMETFVTEVNTLRAQQDALKLGAADDDQKKKIELLQKQIEVLQKLIELLASQIKKQPAAPALEKLETQAAKLEARSVQAAQRDQDLANAIDDMREHIDARDRAGPQLPAQLKEFFLGSGTNESPLSIYGQFLFGYHEFKSLPGQFESPQFSPYFLLKLNEHFVLECDIDMTRAGVDLPNAQVDWLINDWLTLVAGRYLTPIGFFNERLNHEWINKLPDVPLMFRQVSPLSSTDGLQVRGSAYLGNTPVKMEYSLYAGNGFQANPAVSGLNQVADIETIVGGPDEVDSKAFGGRLGIWIPECGLTAGFSAYYQDRYSVGTHDNIRLWDVDAGYHHGNWDFRFEFAQMMQQAVRFIGNDISRTGLYVQAAYRDYDCEVTFLRNLEFVARYSMTRFRGIEANQLDPTTFPTPLDVPVNRDQYTLGINYYFYPSMNVKFAYEINYELGTVNLHDNEFLAQFVWAF